MTPLFTEGFFVRKPAWHLGGHVLDDFPSKEEGMRLAGHDFSIEEEGVYREDGRRTPGYKQLIKCQQRPEGERDATHGMVLNCVKESYSVVDNGVCWDISEAIVGAKQTAKYETGVTLEEGRKCAITFWLDEPGQVSGDSSPIYPFGVVNWTHDGTGSIRAIKTSIRIECANTLNMADLQARRSGREFTFRHTKNVMARIEDAKLVLAGISADHLAFMELAEELAQLKVSEEQRELFVTLFIPSPPETLISERVAENIDRARATVRGLLTHSETVPDAHRLTGYGLMNAGVEYLDHLRGFKTHNTYVNRTLLRPEPMKAKLVPLIKEVAKA